MQAASQPLPQQKKQDYRHYYFKMCCLLLLPYLMGAKKGVEVRADCEIEIDAEIMDVLDALIQEISMASKADLQNALGPPDLFRDQGHPTLPKAGYHCQAQLTAGRTVGAGSNRRYVGPIVQEYVCEKVQFDGLHMNGDKPSCDRFEMQWYSCQLGAMEARNNYTITKIGSNRTRIHLTAFMTPLRSGMMGLGAKGMKKNADIMTMNLNRKLGHLQTGLRLVTKEAMQLIQANQAPVSAGF